MRKVKEAMRKIMKGKDIETEDGPGYNLSYYIARYIDSSTNLDEVQMLLLAYGRQQPAIISGPPGMGKTQLIKFIGKLVGKRVYRKGCYHKMPLDDLIGKEILGVERAGGTVATKSDFEEGSILTAMKEGAIAYIDEFNLLDEGVQKGLNTILEETPEYRLSGEKTIEAKPGFWIVMSYNPMSGHQKARDVEEAVGDRCEYVYLKDLPKDLLARISLVKAGVLSTDEIIDEDMEKRGVIIEETEEGVKFRFVYYDKEDNDWKDFFTGETVSEEDEKKIKPYLVYTGSGNKMLDINKAAKKREYLENIYKLALKLADFEMFIRGILENGVEALPEDFRQRYAIDSFELMEIPKPSPRVIIRALKKYNQLLGMGAKPDQIEPIVTKHFIEDILRGEYQFTKLGEITYGDFIKMMAISKRLIPAEVYPDIKVEEEGGEDSEEEE
ncbi:AAA family ATPase [Candidatus Woesearchaeota archaeon]|nr:AAA family ATPase [Candidatus Woesearchaeota archaeon]